MTMLKHLSPDDEEFLMSVEEDLRIFMESEDQTLLHLESMNSYQRRLVHHLIKPYHLGSTSEGEGADRHIVITKTENSCMPAAQHRITENRKIPVWSYGEREFFVPMNRNTEITLIKNGTVGVYQGEDERLLLDRRIVTSGAFKIKNNKIIEFQDDEW